jgi:HrpA-like RNA helicase
MMKTLKLGCIIQDALTQEQKDFLTHWGIPIRYRKGHPLMRGHGGEMTQEVKNILASLSITPTDVVLSSSRNIMQNINEEQDPKMRMQIVTQKIQDSKQLLQLSKEQRAEEFARKHAVAEELINTIEFQTLLHADSIVVKFILADISNYPDWYTSNSEQPYGDVHVGLLFNSLVVEWVGASMCIPHSYTVSNVLVAHDLTTIEKADIPSKVQTLAKIITDWNVSKRYNGSTNNQQFIDTIIDTLQLKKIKSRVLKPIIKQMRMGKMDYEIELDPLLLEQIKDKLEGVVKINWDKKSVTFSTHVELDRFVEKILEHYPGYFDTETGKQQYALLKSIDRAFWLRFEKYRFEDRKMSELKLEKLTQKGSLTSDEELEMKKLQDIVHACKTYAPIHKCPFENPFDHSLRGRSSRQPGDRTRGKLQHTPNLNDEKEFPPLSGK